MVSPTCPACLCGKLPGELQQGSCIASSTQAGMRKTIALWRSVSCQKYAPRLPSSSDLSWFAGQRWQAQGAAIPTRAQHDSPKLRTGQLTAGPRAPWLVTRMSSYAASRAELGCHTGLQRAKAAADSFSSWRLKSEPYLITCACTPAGSESMASALPADWLIHDVGTRVHQGWGCHNLLPANLTESADFGVSVADVADYMGTGQRWHCCLQGRQAVGLLT